MPKYADESKLNRDLPQVSVNLLSVITAAAEKFKSLSEEQWSARHMPGKWSKKEVLGHLIDSAANNHIRFIKAQLTKTIFIGPSYEQEFFVASQQCQERNTADLIELWLAYNKHIAHVIRYIDPSKLDVGCKIGEAEPVSLLYVVEDYIEHMKHHLAQIVG
jgi:hypothetical protein